MTAREPEETEETEESEENEETEQSTPPKKTPARRTGTTVAQEKKLRAMMREEARGAFDDWFKANKPTQSSRDPEKQSAVGDWFRDVFGF